MRLSEIALTVLLFMLAVSWLGWVGVSATVLGVTALVTGILRLLEGVSVVTYTVPVRRQPAE